MPITSNLHQMRAEIDRMAASLLREVEAAAQAEMAQSVERVALATPESEIDHPHMRELYRVEHPSPVDWELINLADYARAVAFGRKAVDIVPKTKKWLRWPDASLPGGFAFARGVHQPRRPPNPELSAALDEEEAYLTAALDAALVRVVRSFP